MLASTFHQKDYTEAECPLSKFGAQWLHHDTHTEAQALAHEHQFMCTL